MILANGNLYETNEQNRILSDLSSKLTDTLLHQELDRQTVIRAFDEISTRLASGEFESLLSELDPDSTSLYGSDRPHDESRLSGKESRDRISWCAQR